MNYLRFCVNIALRPREFSRTRGFNKEDLPVFFAGGVTRRREGRPGRSSDYHKHEEGENREKGKTNLLQYE